MCCDRAALALALALAACARSEPTCADAVARKDHAAAATRCEAELERRGDAAAGIAAARAHMELGKLDAAAALAEKLSEGPRAVEARTVLGRVRVKQKRFAEARPLLEDALRRHQQAGNHASAYEAAASLVGLLWDIDDMRAALEMTAMSVAAADKSGDAALQAKAYLARGTLFQAVGDRRRAIAAFERAAALLPPGDDATRAYLLVHRGMLLVEEGQHALARPLLGEARELSTRAGRHDLLVALEVNLADIALRERRLDDAERHLDGAEVAWRAIGEPAPSRVILINRATIARLRGDLSAAGAALDQAEQGEIAAEHGWALAQARGELAEARGDVAAAEASYSRAMAIVEEMWRTAAPEDLEAPYLEDRWQPYQSLFGLRLRTGAVRDAFAAVIAAQGRMFLDEVATAALATPSAGDLPRSELLRALRPSLAASDLARPLDATATLEALKNDYVVVYFTGVGRMHALVIERGEVRSGGVDVPLGELDRLVDELLAAPDDEAAARALGEALLPPAIVAAAPTRFHVVPDGPLLRVPFAALFTGPARLVERHEIAYAPSATALALLRTAPPRPRDSAVVLADARRDLANAGTELQVVIDRTRARSFAAGSATTAAFRSAADAGLLHVVGHSGVGLDGGYLVLADGNVTSADVLAWRVRPEVVVLPTCASAATPRREMWGSLAAAFLAAGSRNVVATLYSVEDAVAAEFTAAFYEHGGASDPVGATARAQRTLARRLPPAAWSGFIVAGL